MRDKKYLKWIRSLECCACGAPADVAHHATRLKDSGMSIKTSDYNTIPLCGLHHTELHNGVGWILAREHRWLRQTQERAKREEINRARQTIDF